MGTQVYSEDIKANIYLLDLPTSPVLVTEVEEGKAATLSLTAGLYPRPENIVWTMKSLTGAVETVLPGGKTASYEAADLQLEVGPVSLRQPSIDSLIFQPGSREDYYRLTLNISQLDQQELAKTHEVSITTRDTTRTVSFEFALRKDGGIQTVRRCKRGEEWLK